VKVLFVPWGQPTHYFYMVPLTWALRAAGHEIRIAGQPGTAAAVKNSGMTVATVGRSYDFTADMQAITAASLRKMPLFRQVVKEGFGRYREAGAPAAPPAATAAADSPKESGSPIQRLQASFAPFVKAAVAMADELVTIAQSWRPDLVIADPFVLAAPLAAQAAQAPLVHLLWGPAVHRQIRFFPISGGPPEVWPDDLRELFGRFGVAPSAEYAVGSIDSCPDRLQFPDVPGRLPVRFVPYNGPGDIPDWLSRPPGRPRVCVSWGTSSTVMAGPEGFLVPRVLEALAGFDVDVVVTLPAADRDLLGTPPPGVRVVCDLPLNLLLPTCDAVIHHGGSGTMLTAAALGVPQLMLVGIMDHVTNADRLTAAGAGASVAWQDADVERVAEAARLVLADEAIRGSATRLQEEIQALPSPADLATTLDDLVRLPQLDAAGSRA
jgi:UDP:flavonoid glycosyltransferase YjiC (YdhE family)